jgi:acetyl esterase/lipase
MGEERIAMDRRAFLASAAALAATVFAFPAEARRQGRVTASYGPAKLDIYAPAGAQGAAPVIVYAHGGGWRNGNRRYVQEKPAFFNGLGLVFVSIDYRMLPDAPVATQRDDVTAAVAWVRENIARHGGDPRRIFLMGHSAGAHLASLSALTTARRMVRGFIANDVNVYDIEEYYRATGGKWMPVFAAAFPDQSQWAELSPATHAGPDTPPPALILWSRVRHHAAMAQSFAADLRAPGGRVRLFDGSKFSHAGINKLIGTPAGRPIDQALIDFLRSAGVSVALSRPAPTARSPGRERRLSILRREQR